MPAAPDRRQRRARRRAGTALLLLGAALLGWYGWQVWGTTWVAQRDHARIREELTEAWAGGADDVEVDGVRATAVVRVPRFGADFAVPLLTGTADDTLARGLGRYDGSARPGGRGNLTVAGHRVTHGEPFRDLPALEVGDRVLVETREAVHTYVVDTAGDALSVPFTATWVLDREPVNPEPDGPGPRPGPGLLTLTTCAELFHTDDRLVVFGHLVSSEPRGRARDPEIPADRSTAALGARGPAGPP